MSTSQIAQLNEQIAILQANLAELDGLVKDVSSQYQSIQDLGVMHALLFMSSQAVFLRNYRPQDEM